MKHFLIYIFCLICTASIAQKISDLPAATTPLAGTELLPVVQGGTTKRATAQNIADLAGVGVSDGDKGDITVSASGATWTVDNTAISYAKFQNLTGLSVFGRSANSSGVAADITAGTDGHVLRRSGTTLGFGTIGDASISDLAFSKLTGVPTTFVNAVGAIGASPNANGATIASNTLTLQPASASFGGVMTTGTQTIAGAKTFSSNFLVGSTTTGIGLSSTSGVMTLYAGGGSSVVGRSTSGNFLYTDIIWQSPGMTFSSSGNTTDTNATYISGTPTTLVNRFLNNANGSAFTINSAGSSFGDTFSYAMLNMISGFAGNLTATFRGIHVAPTINVTGGASTVVLLDINPTLTSTTGVTLYGLRSVPTGALNGFATGTPVSTLETAQSFAAAITSTSADLTLTVAHYTVLVDASGAARTITLPAASGCTRRIYIIKKTDASANNVVLDGNASETIDGATTQTITAQYAGYQIQSNGTAWFITSSF